MQEPCLDQIHLAHTSVKIHSLLRCSILIHSVEQTHSFTLCKWESHKNKESNSNSATLPNQSYIAYCVCALVMQLWKLPTDSSLHIADYKNPPQHRWPKRKQDNEASALTHHSVLRRSLWAEDQDERIKRQNENESETGNTRKSPQTLI